MFLSHFAPFGLFLTSSYSSDDVLPEKTFFCRCLVLSYKTLIIIVFPSIPHSPHNTSLGLVSSVYFAAARRRYAEGHQSTGCEGLGTLCFMKLNRREKNCETDENEKPHISFFFFFFCKAPHEMENVIFLPSLPKSWLKTNGSLVKGEKILFWKWWFIGLCLRKMLEECCSYIYIIFLWWRKLTDSFFFKNLWSQDTLLVRFICKCGLGGWCLKATGDAVKGEDSICAYCKRRTSHSSALKALHETLKALIQGKASRSWQRMRNQFSGKLEENRIRKLKRYFTKGTDG